VRLIGSNDRLSSIGPVSAWLNAMLKTLNRPTTRALVTLTTGALLVLGAGATLAQRRGSGGPGGFGGYGGSPRPFHPEPNAGYDGRFTFVRVSYETAPGGYWYRGLPAWAHGYPIAEQHLMKIMNEISYLGAHDQEIDVLSLDDPELMKYPVAYIIEVSWWTLTDREADGLRAYIQKGGFVIVDDFKVTGDRGSPGWGVFEANMKRVLPDARFVDMEVSHPIFHAFFEIGSLADFPQAYNAGRPIFRGLYEDNDPGKRLQMIVNYNTDISQFWEWSGRGLRPVPDTNEAYKLGVNYIVYGLTH
jgi:hypothetical protein